MVPKKKKLLLRRPLGNRKSKYFLKLKIIDIKVQLHVRHLEDIYSLSVDATIKPS